MELSQTIFLKLKPKKSKFARFMTDHQRSNFDFLVLKSPHPKFSNHGADFFQNKQSIDCLFFVQFFSEKYCKNI